MAVSNKLFYSISEKKKTKKKKKQEQTNYNSQTRLLAETILEKLDRVQNAVDARRFAHERRL